jgi:SAM-dependent methyltransferase/acyl carrier protein
LFRIAPHCENYTATDFSHNTLEYLRDNLHSLGAQAGAVELLERAAHDIHDLPTQGYDVVILNSVAQYFPSLDYFLEVMRAALERLAPGGSLFLGDLRSLALLPGFTASLELFSAPATLSLRALNNTVLQQMSLDNELIIHPSLFSLLQGQIPHIGHVRVLPKRAARHNELSKYRYDVIVQREPPRLTPLTWETWGRDGLSLETLPARLKLGVDVVAVDRVPNSRVLGDTRAARLIAEPGELQTVSDLRRALGQENGGVDPEELERQAQLHGYRLELSWLDGWEDGSYRAVFTRKERPMPAFALDAPPKREMRACANSPAQALLRRQLGAHLREHLSRRLPEYMAPAAFVCLPRFPLTPNGKLDRNALPDPQRRRAIQEFVAPRNSSEQRLARIWAEVLGQSRIGVHDDFFDLGGHSLLATQVIARIRQTFGVELALRVMFEAASIAKLATLLPAQEGPPSDSGTSRIATIERRARSPQAQDRLRALIEAGSREGALR